MKKILSILTLTVFMSANSYADITKVEMGAGIWMQTPSGSVNYNGGANGFNVMNETQDSSGYIWALVKHPLSTIPNFRVEYVKISSDGTANGSWGSTPIVSSKSTLDIRQIDLIPYYNILDNTFWTTLDLGIDIKVVDLAYKIASASYEYKKTVPLPMAYARVRVEVPRSNLGGEADIKYITDGSSIISDARVKFDYTFRSFLVLQPALEVGYRVQKIRIDESGEDIKTNIDFAGFYTGLMLRF
ncbi:MAG: TIGR04219 family outer membrane beta-barrel protein [Thiovulaceae bacterium]|nr:TIGR04219 family outer membrane beta-barrel protein [Sulfurimonadaceae bacterium]